MPQFSAGKRSTTFGQKILGYNTRRAENSGGGGGGGIGLRFRNRWAPPKGVTTKIHLLPGDYLNFEGEETEFFQHIEHFAKRSNRGFCCSKQYQIVDGSLATIGGKCLGCRERDQGAEDISWRQLNDFNVLHLEWYHSVPALDRKTNRPMKYTRGAKEGQPIMNEVPCEGRRCPHCKEGAEKFFGRHVYWSVGPGHMEDLAGIVTEIEKDCANCGSRASIEIVSYECEECGHPIVDMNTTDMKLEAITSYVSYVQECPKCSHRALPMRQFECSNCKDPLPLSIFDCALEIKRQGENTNSTVQVPRWEMEDIPEELLEKCKPFNFKQIFAPDPFEIQAQVLKIKNPWSSDGKDANPDDHSENYADDAKY